MKNLSTPTMEAYDTYIKLKEKARSKEKIERLEILESYIKERYKIYENHRFILESIPESQIIDENDKLILQSCYNRNDRGYFEGEIVAEIINMQTIQYQNRCPYCGLDKPRTIDHYLPQSIFPEFSVYPCNLIPCCGYCNTKKNKYWLKDNKRLFLNFYFDNIPEEKFLYANLIYDKPNSTKPTVSFELKNNGNILPELFEVIQNHYKSLDLLKQYSLSVEEILSSIDDKIRNEKLPIKLHKKIINNELNSFSRLYGINYWQTSVLEAIINCEDFFGKYELNYI